MGHQQIFPSQPHTTAGKLSPPASRSQSGWCLPPSGGGLGVFNIPARRHHGV